MPEGLLATVTNIWPPGEWAGVTTLVAVSGGPDSLALLRALHTLRADGPGRLIVGHYNHRTRGIASDDDESFVLETCQKLGLSCEVGHAARGAFDQLPDGFEAAARAARYEFLEATAKRLGARYVAIGHTADDQAETILHRILRGTGIAGLAGIPRVRVLNDVTTLIRPLLSARRAEVLGYLAQIGQPYREDATNRDPDYTRNRLRHDLLPLLEADYNPQAVDALLRLGSLAADAQTVVDEQVAKLFDAAVRVVATGVVVDCRELARARPYLVRELFMAIWRSQNWPEQAMSYDKWNELAQLAKVENGKRVMPGGILADKSANILTLTGITNDESE